MRQISTVEVWGGAEITCNRVADTYFDQMVCSGHASRPADLEAFASLGLRTLRTGLLWERHEQEPSWKWSDARLAQMQQLGIRPIAGLVHHGSGPPHTSLLDPEFPQKLARYAEAVARRYPWIDAYTPINEPHTTARFSALYGMWYPHHMSRQSYLLALLHQMKAIALSMAGDSPGKPDSTTRPDGRHRPHMDNSRTSQDRRNSAPTPLACFRSAVRNRGPSPSSISLHARFRNPGRTDSLVSGSSLPARHHRDQLLRNQRSISRSSN